MMVGEEGADGGGDGGCVGGFIVVVEGVGSLAAIKRKRPYMNDPPATYRNHLTLLILPAFWKSPLPQRSVDVL